MAKKVWVNVSGIWKEVINVYVNVSGIWKQETMPYVNVGGVQKPCMEYSLFDSSLIPFTTATPTLPSEANYTYSRLNADYTSINHYLALGVSIASCKITSIVDNLNGTFDIVVDQIVSLYGNSTGENCYQITFNFGTTLSLKNTVGATIGTMSSGEILFTTDTTGIENSRTFYMNRTYTISSVPASFFEPANSQWYFSLSAWMRNEYAGVSTIFDETFLVTFDTFSLI